MPWRSGLGALALVAACSGGDAGPTDAVRDDRDGANPGPVPTMTGGVALDELDPVTVLVGAELSFGAPLPSEQAAADAFVNDPEVRAAVARRAHGAVDGRRLADVVVLALEGSELFDESVLAAFERGIVGGLSGADVEAVPLAGGTVLHATGPAGGVVGFREGNLLVVVSAPVDADAVLVATRQVEARARGEVGSGTPVTPLVPLPIDAAFVPVPTLTFAPIPPPEEEPPPPLPEPGLAGASGITGRYGVMAGERRTVVWAFTADPAVHGSAESLEPAMRDLVTARAGGVVPQVTEVIDRVVLASSGEVGAPSARIFRHQGLVLLVEGTDPAQLDAATTAWIAALAGV